MVWGKLAGFAATLGKGAHIEVEGQLRHRVYQKEISTGKKNIDVYINVSEIHAGAIRKLDRNGSHPRSGDDQCPTKRPTRR